MANLSPIQIFVPNKVIQLQTHEWPESLVRPPSLINSVPVLSANATTK